MIRTAESGILQFEGSNQKSVTFTKSYNKAPIVTLTSSGENLNVFVNSVTLVGFIAEKSDEDTSEFHWVAIEVY